MNFELTDLLFGHGAEIFALATRYLTPLLAVVILLRCVRSMLSERYEPETWGYLYLPGEIMVPLKHWECIIGRSRSADACIDSPGVAKTHACLMRSAEGEWTVYPLGRSHTEVDGEAADAQGTKIADADVLTLGHIPCRFVDLTEDERARLLKYRHAPGRRTRPAVTFFYLSVLQMLLAFQQCILNPDADGTVAAAFAALCGIQWAYFFIVRGLGARGFEADTLAFFLTTLGLSVAASSAPDSMLKQLLLIGAGVILFVFLSLWTRDLGRVKKMRWPVGAAALGMLALTLLLAKVTYGARNWITIGGFTLQPSEFVKVCYIYVGAATLDRLFVNRNLIFFIGFSAVCVGALALMGDFGTALIFFMTFLVISFMRSGSFATNILAIGAAGIAVMFILSVKPYIADRFSTWGHVWEDVYGDGWQQARAMCAAASGGLFGQGAGRGWLVDIFAADMDMVWAVLCEELGLITALCAIAALIVMALFVVKNAASNRSSYYAIAAAAAVSMLMVQMGLNVFGAMDILPFTGVTFPFVSRGGSSLLSCWMLLAFVKACDTRANASFAVKRPERFTGGAGVEPPPEDAAPAPEADDGGIEWHLDNGGDR